MPKTLEDHLWDILDDPELNQQYRKYMAILDGVSMATRGVFFPVVMRIVMLRTHGMAGAWRADVVAGGWATPAQYQAAIDELRHVKGLRVDDDGYITVLEFEEDGRPANV